MHSGKPLQKRDEGMQKPSSHCLSFSPLQAAVKGGPRRGVRRDKLWSRYGELGRWYRVGMVNWAGSIG